LKSKTGTHAERLRTLWESLSDAVAKRLIAENVVHTLETQRMVTSVLLLMSARSAASLDIGPDDFKRIARMAHEVCAGPGSGGARRMSRMWVTKGGLA